MLPKNNRPVMIHDDLLTDYNYRLISLSGQPFFRTLIITHLNII
jgi:hypothetical protein